MNNHHKGNQYYGQHGNTGRHDDNIPGRDGHLANRPPGRASHPDYPPGYSAPNHQYRANGGQMRQHTQQSQQQQYHNQKYNDPQMMQRQPHHQPMQRQYNSAQYSQRGHHPGNQGYHNQRSNLGEPYGGYHYYDEPYDAQYQNRPGPIAAHHESQQYQPPPPTSSQHPYTPRDQYGGGGNYFMSNEADQYRQEKFQQQPQSAYFNSGNSGYYRELNGAGGYPGSMPQDHQQLLHMQSNPYLQQQPPQQPRSTMEIGNYQQHQQENQQYGSRWNQQQQPQGRDNAVITPSQFYQRAGGHQGREEQYGQQLHMQQNRRSPQLGRPQSSLYLHRTFDIDNFEKFELNQKNLQEQHQRNQQMFEKDKQNTEQQEKKDEASKDEIAVKALKDSMGINKRQLKNYDQREGKLYRYRRCKSQSSNNNNKEGQQIRMIQKINQQIANDQFFGIMEPHTNNFKNPQNILNQIDQSKKNIQTSKGMHSRQSKSQTAQKNATTNSPDKQDLSSLLSEKVDSNDANQNRSTQSQFDLNATAFNPHSIETYQEENNLYWGATTNQMYRGSSFNEGQHDMQQNYTKYRSYAPYEDSVQKEYQQIYPSSQAKTSYMSAPQAQDSYEKPQNKMLSQTSKSIEFQNKKNFDHQNQQYRKIFVGGLPHSLAMYHFRNYFGQFGQIEDCVILKDKRTQKPRGFGFVTYKDVRSVHQVMKDTDKHMIQGKWVDCKCAIPEYQMKQLHDEQEKRDYYKDPHAQSQSIFFQPPPMPKPVSVNQLLPTTEQSPMESAKAQTEQQFFFEESFEDVIKKQNQSFDNRFTKPPQINESYLHSQQDIPIINDQMGTPIVPQEIAGKSGAVLPTFIGPQLPPFIGPQLPQMIPQGPMNFVPQIHAQSLFSNNIFHCESVCSSIGPFGNLSSQQISLRPQNNFAQLLMNQHNQMSKGEHAFFNQHLSTFFYQSVYEPINLELNLTSSSESNEEELLTDNLYVAGSHISDSELYMNHTNFREDWFTQQTQKVIDITEKTFKEKNDNGQGYKEPSDMKEFLLVEKPFVGQDQQNGGLSSNLNSMKCPRKSDNKVSAYQQQRTAPRMRRSNSYSLYSMLQKEFGHIDQLFRNEDGEYISLKKLKVCFINKQGKKIPVKKIKQKKVNERFKSEQRSHELRMWPASPYKLRKERHARKQFTEQMANKAAMQARDKYINSERRIQTLRELYPKKQYKES